MYNNFKKTKEGRVGCKGKEVALGGSGWRGRGIVQLMEFRLPSELRFERKNRRKGPGQKKLKRSP